jgi:hypothetical protein
LSVRLFTQSSPSFLFGVLFLPLSLAVCWLRVFWPGCPPSAPSLWGRFFSFSSVLAGLVPLPLSALCLPRQRPKGARSRKGRKRGERDENPKTARSRFFGFFRCARALLACSLRVFCCFGCGPQNGTNPNGSRRKNRRAEDERGKGGKERAGKDRNREKTPRTPPRGPSGPCCVARLSSFLPFSRVWPPLFVFAVSWFFFCLSVFRLAQPCSLCGCALGLRRAPCSFPLLARSWSGFLSFLFLFLFSLVPFDPMP